MSSVKLLDLEQGSDAWHAWRQGGIGASDVSALFDKNPYKTARDLWCEKQGFASPQDGSEWLFKKGHDVEAVVRKIASEQLHVDLKPVCAEKEDIFRASLDGFDPSVGVIEVKYVGKKVLDLANNEAQIPEHHRIQIQMQLFCVDANYGHWIGSDGKIGVRVEIKRDRALIEEIREKGHSFWKQVQSGKAPPLGAKDTLFINDRETIEVANEFKRLKAEKQRVEAELSRLENYLKALDGHTKIRVAGLEIQTIKKQGSISYANVPEIKGLAKSYLEQFRKPATFYKKIVVKE